jgi:hypothetical protein
MWAIEAKSTGVNNARGVLKEPNGQTAVLQPSQATGHTGYCALRFRADGQGTRVGEPLVLVLSRQNLCASGKLMARVSALQDGLNMLGAIVV